MFKFGILAYSVSENDFHSEIHTSPFSFVFPQAFSGFFVHGLYCSSWYLQYNQNVGLLELDEYVGKTLLIMFLDCSTNLLLTILYLVANSRKVISF